ncbi:dihydrofolate reductase type 3 [Muribaculaceae bacterium]|jgi:dihydrofolate reductase|nr:dihydrofolate reductase type 3 [Muribaculaceae bacterium]
MVCIIVAIDRRGAIGRGGDLLFYIKDDLRRFKALTMGNTLVMGRRTFESLPKGALPGRRNIVVSRNAAYTAPGIEVAPSLEAALALAADGPGDTFVIGGGQIYAQALAKADVLELTVVDAEAEAPDTYFPAIPLDDYRVEKIERGEGYSFVTLVKV